MRDTDACPECEGYDTEVVMTDWRTDHVERVKVCNDCPTQFTVSYGSPYVSDVHKVEP